MVPFHVIMRHELLDRAPQRALAKANHAAQALLPNGAHIPFGESISRHASTPVWCRLNACRLQHVGDVVPLPTSCRRLAKAPLIRV